MLGGMERPQHHAWVITKSARYYQVHLDRDLFGDWTLLKVWGGIDSNQGRTHHPGVSSYEDGLGQVHEITRRRAQRGYHAMRTD